MEEQKNIQEQQLKLMKVQTGILACMLALVLAVGIFVTVQVASVMNQLSNLSPEKLNTTIGMLQEVAEELNKLDMDTINEAVAALKDAGQTLAKLDIDALNDAIASLSGAGEKLQEIDIGKLNELLGSLEAVVAQMERTVGAFSRLFGR